MELDDEIVLGCAMRYAIGRQTYVVDSVTSKLIKEEPNLNVHFKTRVAKEIEEAIAEGHAGDTCDIHDWKKVMHLYRKENWCKVKAFKVAPGKGRIEEVGKEYPPIEVSDEFEIKDAVKMDGLYYSLDMKTTYHTVKELNEKGEEI